MRPLFQGPHHRHRIIIIVIVIIKAACKRSLLSGGSVSWHSFSLILGPTFCAEIQAAVRIDFSKLKNGEDCFVIRCVHDLHPLSMHSGPPPSHYQLSQNKHSTWLPYFIPKQQKDCLQRHSDPGDTCLTFLNKPSNLIKSDHIQSSSIIKLSNQPCLQQLLPQLLQILWW